MKIREEKIFDYVRNHSYCSRDNIFTKGKIPKSKATTDLIDWMVSRKKINVDGMNGKRYFVGELDPLREADLMFKGIDCMIKHAPKKYYNIVQKFREFLRTRFKVLKYEAQRSDEFEYGDTLYLMTIFLAVADNNTKLGEAFLLDTLDWAIKDDKYYLKHHSHASHEKIKLDYHKSKEVPRRKGIVDLLDMKKKGKGSRYKYGLKSNSAYNNHMKNLGDEPSEWFDRVFAEEDRILYKDTSKLKKEVYKKILSSVKLNQEDPDYEIKKKLLDLEKKSFPNIPMIDISEILPNKLKSLTESVPPKNSYEIKYDKMLEICVFNVIMKGLEENHLRRTVKTLTEKINNVVFSASNYNKIMRRWGD